MLVRIQSGLLGLDLLHPLQMLTLLPFLVLDAGTRDFRAPLGFGQRPMMLFVLLLCLLQ